MQIEILGRGKKKESIEISDKSYAELFNNSENLFNKHRYINLRNLSWQFLIDMKVNKLPIDLFEIIKKNGWALKRYSEIKDKDILRYCENLRASAFTCNNNFIIAYNDSFPLSIVRYSIAHEISHIICLHFNLNEIDLEKEAEMLAARLLMPAFLIKELDLKSPEEIAKVFNVSLAAAKIRYKRYLILKERNMFYSHPLERQLKYQFEDFIKNYKKN